MSDSDLVQAAYSNLINQLFATFYESYTYAKGNRMGEQEAERIFADGVAHARFIRDRATSLLT